MKEMTVRNFRRSRKFGWGYSFTPTSEDAYTIEIPASPVHVGTIGQILKAQQEDRTWKVHRQNAYCCTAWFYDGQRIIQLWQYTILRHADYNLGSEDWYGNEYGYAWVPGFPFDLYPDEKDVWIRVAPC